MWKKDFKLHDGSYSVSDIQYYFDHIIKKQEKFTGNLLERIHVSKIETRKCKIKKGYYRQLSTPKKIKLLRFTNKNCKTLHHLEVTKALLVHCIIVSNDCQQESCIHLFLINC